MNRCWYAAVVVSFASLPSVGRGQVPTLPKPAGAHICIDECDSARSRPLREPAIILKDSAGRVLAMVAPADSAHYRQLARILDPKMIADVRAVSANVLSPILGSGFENGLAIVTLTSAGIAAWHPGNLPAFAPP